ncbi:MAG: sugar phosphate isomerase/epimerase [Candidatus Latescibacteria bacterium]|nr:sugar phosphate isomerase/epimerase [Candidatus Latescibacterota bacterium]
MNFATCMGLFLKERLCDDHFRRVREHGFDTVELGIYPGHFQARDEEVVWLEKSLREHEIHVHSMHCSFDALTGERLDETKQILHSNLRLLADLGGRYLVVHYAIFADPDDLIVDEKGKPYPGFSVARALKRGPEMLERIKEGMASYAEYARRLGVAIALETDLQNSERLIEFISEADPSACGICFDSGHAQLDSDAAPLARLLGPRVIDTHLHDNDGKEDQHQPPLSGTIDWKGVLGGLKAGGYSGPLTYETLSGSLADIAVLNDRLSTLWKKTW